MADLRLFEDVVPKRGCLIEALLFGYLPIWTARDLSGGEGILDPHCLGDVLARGQPKLDTALHVPERQIPTPARQVMQFWDKERVQLPCMIEGEFGSAVWGAEIVETTPVDDPVTRQHRNRQRPRGWVRSKIT